MREPLPNSTNYLNAYNKSGELKRAMQMQPGEDLPSERPSDLKPFPPNENFLSQPVTSEELRENIWTAIMKDGLSVKEVSARYRVEMNRVGAIVRLKEVEMEWLRQVSVTTFYSMPKRPAGRYCGDDFINRLVYKTTIMVTKYSMRASLNSVPNTSFQYQPVVSRTN